MPRKTPIRRPPASRARPEPAFPIAKPFKAEMVKSIMGQQLVLKVRS